MLKDVLNPCDRFAKVFPTFLISKIFGALISYQSVMQVLSQGITVHVKEPTFAGERVDDFLLQALLTLRQTFVL